MPIEEKMVFSAQMIQSCVDKTPRRAKMVGRLNERQPNTLIVSGRGRLQKIKVKTIKKNLKFNGVSPAVINDKIQCCHFIQLANPF